MVVDWSKQPFIRTGYSAPRVGQVFTIGKELNEPFQGRLFFAVSTPRWTTSVTWKARSGPVSGPPGYSTTRSACSSNQS
jgi:hypothetical protein